MPPRKVDPNKPVRTGFFGFIQDRLEHIQKAYRNYIKEAESQRRSLDTVGKSSNIKYETKPKNEAADRRARKAGKIERLR